MVPASVVEFVFAALDGARCPDGSRMVAAREGDATVLATSRGVFRVVVVPADDEGSEVLSERTNTEQSDSSVPMRLAQHLTAEAVAHRCELTADNGSERCAGDAVAIRWEDGFADSVCEHHTQTATGRAAILVYPRMHDGTRS